MPASSSQVCGIVGEYVVLDLVAVSDALDHCMEPLGRCSGAAAGNAHLDPVGAALALDGDHFADPVYVTGDDMSAQLVADPRGALQVDGAALSPIA